VRKKSRVLPEGHAVLRRKGRERMQTLDELHTEEDLTNALDMILACRTDLRCRISGPSPDPVTRQTDPDHGMAWDLQHKIDALSAGVILGKEKGTLSHHPV